MKENKLKRNFSILSFIIILVILISMFTYAKYIEQKNGQAIANVAQFYFKINDKLVNDTGNINFAITRNDENKKIVDGMLAPGTSGCIPIKIDATGTQTILGYELNINLENKPTNLKFYYDSNKTKEIYIKNNKIIKEGFISYEDEDKIRYENIYWDWAVETGNTLNQIEQNDIDDSRFMDKIMTMNISVIGKQLAQKPRYLVDEEGLQLGDYVNYKASSGIASYTSEDCSEIDGISISNTFSSTDYEEDEGMTWRVLNIDKSNGIVELVAVEPPSQMVILGGNGTSLNEQEKSISAYQNLKTELDKICSVYGKGEGAAYARSINLMDIMKYSTFDPLDKTYNSNIYSSNGGVGGTRAYREGKFLLGEFYEGEDIVRIDEGLDFDNDKIVNVGVQKEATLVTVKQTAYTTDTITEDFFDDNPNIYNMLFQHNFSYCLASRGVSLREGFCLFDIVLVENRKLSTGHLYNSAGDSRMFFCNVLPVVSLETNIKTIGQANRCLAIRYIEYLF